MLALDRRLLAVLVACEALDLSAAAGAAGAAAPSGSMVPSTTTAGHGGNGGNAAGGSGLEATAVFTQGAEGVSVLVVLDGCRDGATYSVRIHAGHSCTDTTSIGDPWDDTRGDGIPDLRCMGAQASLQYVHPNNAAKSWSVGGAPASELIGQVVVINDPDDRAIPVACGEIVAS